MVLKQISIFLFCAFGLIASASASEDKVAFGLSRPPYVMQDQATGISLELFKAIYHDLKRQFRPRYVSNTRMDRNLSQGRVDVAVEVKKTDPAIFYSETFVSYQNFIVTRTADNASVSSFSDLEGMSVCTWQNANEHLGQAFRDVMPSFDYQEFANQDTQVRVFLGGRCDAAIIDQKIFRHWAETLGKDPTFEKHIVSKEFTYHPVPG